MSLQNRKKGEQQYFSFVSTSGSAVPIKCKYNNKEQEEKKWWRRETSHSLYKKKKIIIKMKSKTKTYCLKMTNQKSLATGANEMHNQRLSYFIPSRSIVLDKQMQTEILHSVFICTTSNGGIRLEKKDGKQHNSNGTSPSFRLSICRPITLTLKKRKVLMLIVDLLILFVFRCHGIIFIRLQEKETRPSEKIGSHEAHFTHVTNFSFVFADLNPLN